MARETIPHAAAWETNFGVKRLSYGSCPRALLTACLLEDSTMKSLSDSGRTRR
jgi:hypothetical protein